MRPGTYKNHALVLLTVISLFNYVDRWALGVALEGIKRDLSLSDTQLGLLSGIAFALFYSVMGIPIARWADRGNRITIITATTALWSIAVAMCGGALSFVQLMLIRIGVAVGEAGCLPPAFSLIADYFNRAERPRANAIYGMGAALSLLVGFLAAGWLNQLFGWRMMFVVLGLPGIVLAVLAWLTLKEPRRMSETQKAAYGLEPASFPTAATQPSLREICVKLGTHRTFVHLTLCTSVAYFFGYGIVQWQPSFFARSFGLSSGEIGTGLALAYGCCGLLGAWLGGELTTRYAANNERLQVRAAACAYVTSAIFSVFAYLTPHPVLAILFVGLFVLGPYMAMAPMVSTVQALIPPHMRATAMAISGLMANLIGMGLGPLAAGALSDVLRPELGEESLRYTLLILSLGNLWSAWHAWQASKTVARDIAAVQAHGQIGAAPTSAIHTNSSDRAAVELN